MEFRANGEAEWKKHMQNDMDSEILQGFMPWLILGYDGCQLRGFFFCGWWYRIL